MKAIFLMYQLPESCIPNHQRTQQIEAFKKFIQLCAKTNLHIFRAIHCGYTELTPQKFSDKLKVLIQSKFDLGMYHLLNNNCRNFCATILFDVLNPSESENGKLIS